jgi:hypothetical protein
MSGQIDVGWSAPPFGLDQLDQKQIRIVAGGNDASAFKGQTVRLLITNTQTLQTRKAQLERFMKAYRETIDWMYTDDPAMFKTYATSSASRSRRPGVRAMASSPRPRSIPTGSSASTPSCRTRWRSSTPRTADPGAARPSSSRFRRANNGEKRSAATSRPAATPCDSRQQRSGARVHR